MQQRLASQATHKSGVPAAARVLAKAGKRNLLPLDPDTIQDTLAHIAADDLVITALIQGYERPLANYPFLAMYLSPERVAAWRATYNDVARTLFAGVLDRRKSYPSRIPLRLAVARSHPAWSIPEIMNIDLSDGLE